MTDDQIEDAVETACGEIDNSMAMSPTHASRHQSVDFLSGIIDHCMNFKQTLMQEIEEEAEEGGD